MAKIMLHCCLHLLDRAFLPCARIARSQTAILFVFPIPAL